MSIIDFRLRPPVGEFLQTRIYAVPDNRDRYTRSLGFDPAPSVQQQSMDLLFKEMDNAGITTGVVVARATHNLGTIRNQEVADIVKRHPDRFVGVGAANPSSWRKAIADIDEAMALGLKLVNLEPGVSQPPLHTDDRMMYPIYAHCEEKKIPLVIMCGGGAGPTIDYTAPHRIDRVLSDFPDLTVVASHGGWPWVQEALHVAFRRPNLYVCPDMYLHELPGMNDYILAANSFLSERFLFGTAYPFCPLEQYTEWFRSLPINARAMDNILYRNARRLLALR